MPRHPKQKNKHKLCALALAAGTVVSAAASSGVHRFTIYRRRKEEKDIRKAAPNMYFLDPSKHAKTYIKNPEFGERFDARLFSSRSRAANIEFLRRLLKRNLLTIRRITHKSRKKRSEMERVAGVFSHAIQHAIEESASLVFIEGTKKCESVYNMDQTAIFIDMNGSEGNGFRTSVFLAASATGQKLPLLIVFAGIAGGPVSQAVWSPYFGAPDCEHTVQRKTHCSEEIWMPSVNGCKLLLLDSLKVHKMATVRAMLEEDCCTQV
ncbi:hypothetical protein PHYSODRAFT_325656 [Phytophthora sojae]|uniref:DDE-1 domain-containing protein n=1 Tax=Phytophthora sojae (strain P6497) TaxID=1094619 RepID=G4YXQ9_PHYSP|nr:hypothetical protein PHYSODRAFT_325656 [Phytophthora sojae]EGZ24548.1 hypothetical protein PHYSODRAFT_325656 [Phytophthora sojae]|eukprot:XP_009519836.1 hypothetical protein PHYSODRAFT_325656 [Phytophthora sojae]